MAQINLFRSSACDALGVPMVKAVVVVESTEELGDGFGDEMSEWLKNPATNVMVLDGRSHDIRWLN